MSQLNVAAGLVVHKKPGSQKRPEYFACFESRELRRHALEIDGDFLLDRVADNLLGLRKRLAVFH